MLFIQYINSFIYSIFFKEGFMGRIVEGFWNCTYCGKAKIRGGSTECPNCGKVRDEHTVFDIDRNKIVYVPYEKTSSINRNPDWVCNHCNQLNSDDLTHCDSCGAPRSSDCLDYFENQRKNKKKMLEKKQYEENTRTSNSNIKNISFLNKEISSFKEFCSLHITNILVVLATLFLLIGLIFILIPKEQELTVKDMSWERSINVERYQTVNESDWYLPTGARLHYSQEEFSHYEKVLDHYETKTREVSRQRVSGYEEYVTGYRDLGNGYFEEITSTRPVYETYYETETYQDPVYRDEPVYKTKYYYEIDKWLYERSVKTSGNNKSPYWGDVNLNSDERVSNKNETYYITGLNEKEKELTISLSYDDWNSLEVGQSVKVKVSLGHGKIVE